MGLLSWLGKTYESATPWDEEKQRRQRAAAPVPAPRPTPGIGAPSSINQMNNVPMASRPVNRQLTPVNLGKSLVSGVQQGVGNVADVSLMAGASINDTALKVARADQATRDKYYRGAEDLRNVIKSKKTITGESLNPKEDFKFTGDKTRDIANLAGRSAQAGLDATTFVNPSRLIAGKALAKPTLREAGKFAARDAAFFGSGQGLATGAEVYGQTGDVKQAIKQGAQSGAMAGVAQGAMDVGGHVVGKTARDSIALHKTLTPAQKQGGFIAGPKALGFADAEKAGRVFTDTPDKMPRFEVSDELMKVKNPTASKLGEFIDHPELFKNYEGMKNINIERIAKNSPENASFDPRTNTIRTKSSKDLAPTLHEIQHSIQETEGFARGTNPDAAGGFENYKKYAGEAEADTVTKRMNMTDAERYVGLKQFSVNTGGFDKFGDNTKLPLIAENLKEAKLKAERYGKRHGVDIKEINVTNEPVSINKSTFYYSLDVPKKDLIVKQDGGQANFIERGRTPKNIHPDDQTVMAKFIDYAKGIRTMSNDKAAYELEIAASRVAERYGIDVKLNERTNPTTSLAKAFEDRLAAGRYEGSVAYSLDPENHFIADQVSSHKSAQSFRDDMVNTLWENNKKGKGVETWLTPDDVGGGYSGRSAVSNNSQFYQDFYKEHGYKPTRKAIEDVVDQHLGIKKGGEYSNILESNQMDSSPFDKDIYAQLKDRDFSTSELANTAKTGQITSSQRTPDQVLPEKPVAQPKIDTARTPEQTKGKQPAPRSRQDLATQPSKIKGAVSSGDNTIKETPRKSKFTKEQLDAWDAEGLQPEIKDTPATTGKPVETLVYRGSGGKKTMRAINDLSIFGNDVRYYTPSKEYAGKFGDNIEQKSIKLNNPLVIDNDAAWKAINIKAGNKYPSPVGLSVVEHKQWTDNVRKAIQADGYDGVIVRVPESETTGKTMQRVFDSDQVVPFSDATAPKDSVQPTTSKTQMAGETAPKTAEVPQKTQVSRPTAIEAKRPSGQTPVSSSDTSAKSPIAQPQKTPSQKTSQLVKARELASKKQGKSANSSQSRQLSRGESLSSVNNATPEQVQQYITKQVKAQQLEGSKGTLKQRLNNFTDNAKHTLLDDAVAYERYVKDGKTRTELREGVDRVRGSSMIARQFAEDNGMRELGKMNTKDLNEFQQYLIAKRSQELSARDIKTGRDAGMDAALIKGAGSKFKVQEQIIRDYSRKMLDYSVEHGLVAKELRTALLKESPNYVPMNRVMDAVEGGGFHKSKQLGSLSKQTVARKIEGSNRTVNNPIESLLLNTERMTNEAQRNVVAQKLAKTDAFKERVLKEGEKPAPGNDTISYLDKGKKITIEVPELVAREMKNLNSVIPDYLATAIRILGTPTRLLRTGATSANPIFAGSNLVRDQLQTAITGTATANFKGTPKAFMAAFDPGKTGSGYRAELRRNGIVGSEYRQTYGYKPGQLMKELQAENQLSKQAWQRIKAPVNTLADLIGRTEDFTRAQQFYGTKGDVTTRAQAARNNSLNFSRAGVLTRQINKVVPFINAAAQGGRITVNSFKNRPGHTAGGFAIVTGLALAARALNTAMNEELLDRISEEEKKNNIIVFRPGAHYDAEHNRAIGVVKIPMPQMLYPVLDAANNVKGEAKDIARLAGDIFTAMSGLETDNPLNQLTPTFAKPALEIGLNKSFYTGQDVVSEYDKNEKAEDMGKKYTTGAAREFAGVTGLPAPWFDNIIGNWGGGLAKDISKGMTDNPDNSKDGKGVVGTLAEGGNRRFLSAYVTSQYDIQSDLAKTYKKQLAGNDAFKAMTPDERVKVLDKLDADTKALAGVAAKTEQNRGDEIKKDLSKRQKSLAESGFDADRYLGEVASTAKGSGISNDINPAIPDDVKPVLERYEGISVDDRTNIFNTENDAEFKYNVAKYENDKANGTLTTAQKLTTFKSLQSDSVGSKYPKDVRDLYGVAEATLGDYLAGEEKGVDKLKLAKQLIAYDQALVDAGLRKYLKYKGGIAAAGGGRGGRKSGGKGRKGAQAVNLSQLMSTIKASNSLKPIKTPTSILAKNAPKANIKGVRLTKYEASSGIGKSGRRYTVRRGIV